MEIIFLFQNIMNIQIHVRKFIHFVCFCACVAGTGAGADANDVNKKRINSINKERDIREMRKKT